jgi:uncharacterized lipoprotein YddW (UPF0748 family)
MVNLKVMKKNKSKFLGILPLVILLMAFVACSEKQGTIAKPEVTSTEKVPPFKYWVWITADETRTDASFSEEFAKYSKNGIDAILINTYAKPELLARMVRLAKPANLEVHAWMFTVNRPGDKIAEQHPDWYAVSRDGKSCYDDPPYVGYYKWMCPTRKESREHILHLVEGLAKVEGVASVHLDYIRYSDIFLPISLLPTYNLVQNEELPRFDFCYCDVCAAEFEKQHHRDPRKVENPAIDMEWKNFRLNKIKAIVDDAYTIAHAHGKKLTAAVFPYPEMADHMVRQRWDKWNVDAVLPMIYNSFYNEGVDWVGFATKQGVSDLKGRTTELHTGIYVPPMSTEDVKYAIALAKENGASGISFFDGPAITPEQFEVIQKSKQP